MTEIPIEKRSVAERLDLIRTLIEGVIVDSPSMIPEQPSLEQISNYAHAMSNLSMALDDLDRAKNHLKGGTK